MKSRPALERFYEKVRMSEQENGCWLWQGKLDAEGYGRFRIAPGQPIVRAHKYALEKIKGVLLPTGLHIRHMCPGGPNRSCVNPNHLEVGTAAQNTEDRYKNGRKVTTKAVRLASQMRHYAPNATPEQIDKALDILGLKLKDT
jgi:hypothetical protein